jgi:hypothetical protein
VLGAANTSKEFSSYFLSPLHIHAPMIMIRIQPTSSAVATSEGPIELLGVRGRELKSRTYRAAGSPTHNSQLNRHLTSQIFEGKSKIDRWKTAFEIGAPENQGNQPSVGNGGFQEIFA